MPWARELPLLEDPGAEVRRARNPTAHPLGPSPSYFLCLPSWKHLLLFSQTSSWPAGQPDNQRRPSLGWSCPLGPS